MQGRQDVRLYYGTRNSDATAYSDLDESWKSVGVDTVHVYSDEGKGYVQDVFSQVILKPSCHGQKSISIPFPNAAVVLLFGVRLARVTHS